MLATLEGLVPIVVVLYLLEGLARVRSTQPSFVSSVGEVCRPAAVGLHLAGLLPQGRLIRGRSLALRLGPDGVFWLCSEEAAVRARYDRHRYRFLAYEELADLRVEERTLWWRDTKLLRFASRAEALAFLERLVRIRSAQQSARPQRLEDLEAQAMDACRLGEDLSELKGHSRRLDALSGCLLCGLLGIYPLAIHFDLVSRRALLVGGALLMVTQLAVLATAFRLAGAQRHKGLAVDRGRLAPIAFYPPAAMRAASALTGGAFEQYDSLALALCLSSRAAFLRLARLELQGIEIALAEEAEPSWLWVWSSRRSSIRALLGWAGITEDEVLWVPRSDPSAVARCPLCEDEYLPGVERCADCDIRLVPYREASGCPSSREFAVLRNS